MPVGTGSINRAARSSKKTVGTATAKEPAVKKEAVPKKPAAKKTSAPKEVDAKKATVEKNVPAPELRVYGNETVFVVGNESCQLTQELPVHLL